MKLMVFRSDSGDALLLTTGDERNVLVDAGTPSAYRQHLDSVMGEMRQKRRVLDLIYVSHIDRDHIGGVLEMLDAEVAWRVHEFRSSRGRPSAEPKASRPPEIKAIWHNAFAETVGGEERGPALLATRLVQVLGTQSRILMAGGSDFRNVALDLAFYAQSVGDAVEVGRRIGASQLNIPLNPEFGGKLMVRDGNGSPLEVGSARATVLAPSVAELEELRTEWQAYLTEKADWIKKLLRRHEKDEAALAEGQPEATLRMARLQAGRLAGELGVTPPNLASLVVLFEEAGQRILLTGDAADETILQGLKARSLLDPQGRIHVDVLKVPHHGAHNSFSKSFAEQVTADHYVFCGDGEHDNPELEVVQGYLEARISHPDQATRERQFTMWFNCSPDLATDEHRQLWREHANRFNEWQGRHPQFRARLLTEGTSLHVPLG